MTGQDEFLCLTKSVRVLYEQEHKLYFAVLSVEMRESINVVKVCVNNNCASLKKSFEKVAGTKCKITWKQFLYRNKKPAARNLSRR